MTFSDFFQQNIIFFVAGIGIFAYLLFLEARDFGSRGQTLTPALLTQHVNKGAVLIDLRNAEHYKQGHITGAKNIPLQELKQQADSFNKEQEIVLYCYRGAFSRSGMGTLKKAGFTQVSHLGGGMNSWQQENLPVVKG